MKSARAVGKPVSAPSLLLCFRLIAASWFVHFPGCLWEPNRMWFGIICNENRCLLCFSLGSASLPQRQRKGSRGPEDALGCVPRQPSPPLQSRGYILLNTWNSAIFLCSSGNPKSNSLHPTGSRGKTFADFTFSYFAFVESCEGFSMCECVCTSVYVSVCVNCISTCLVHFLL